MHVNVNGGADRGIPDRIGTAAVVTR